MSRVTPHSPPPRRWLQHLADHGAGAELAREGPKRRLVTITCGQCGGREIGGVWDLDGYGPTCVHEVYPMLGRERGGPRIWVNVDSVNVERWQRDRPRTLDSYCGKCHGRALLATVDLIDAVERARATGAVAEVIATSKSPNASA